MFDIAWSELILVGAVALVVIGPKDLPKAMRTLGQTIGKVRRMASEFQGQFNDAMREAELDELKKQVEDVGGSVSSAMNSDFKPIDTIKDFDAGASGKPADDTALKEAEAKLAALPAPEPLPPVEIPAEAPPAAAEEPKPKRARKAKAEAAAPVEATEAEPAPAKRTRRRKVTEPGEGSPA